MSKLQEIEKLTDEELISLYADGGFRILGVLNALGISPRYRAAVEFVRKRLQDNGIDTTRKVKNILINCGVDRITKTLQESKSITEALAKFSLKDIRTNRYALRLVCDELGIELPKYERNRPTGLRRLSPEDIFKDFTNTNEQLPANTSLKKHFLRYSGVKYACVICGLGEEWNGKPLTLQLDHKDGNKRNNLLENLRLLCPNCHSQTDTFVRKNTSNYASFSKPVGPTGRKCAVEECKNLLFQSDGKYCSISCSSKTQEKIAWPEDNELILLLESNQWNFVRCGKILGVSDNAIRKRLKKRGITPRNHHKVIQSAA